MGRKMDGLGEGSLGPVDMQKKVFGVGWYGNGLHIRGNRRNISKITNMIQYGMAWYFARIVVLDVHTYIHIYIYIYQLLGLCCLDTPRQGTSDIPLHTYTYLIHTYRPSTYLSTPPPPPRPPQKTKKTSKKPPNSPKLDSARRSIA
jgi:hypothetical protein